MIKNKMLRAEWKHLFSNKNIADIHGCNFVYPDFV